MELEIRFDFIIIVYYKNCAKGIIKFIIIPLSLLN